MSQGYASLFFRLMIWGKRLQWYKTINPDFGNQTGKRGKSAISNSLRHLQQFLAGYQNLVIEEHMESILPCLCLLVLLSLSKKTLQAQTQTHKSSKSNFNYAPSKSKSEHSTGETSSAGNRSKKMHSKMPLKKETRQSNKEYAEISQDNTAASCKDATTISHSGAP